MKKKRLISYYIMLALFCQFSLCQTEKVSALSDEERAAIVSSCSSIQVTLKNLQRSDSRARVYLGGHFEKVITNYIKPLNHRLIENNIANIGLSESQANFANLKTVFASDFIDYQKSLEDLIATDCKTNPETFSEKLDLVREKRQTVAVDVENLKYALENHLSLVSDLEVSL